ncbi:MAG: ComEC/Rec2 family competence protein, partial [Nitrospinae bacterium]|nr:ComEC/Rec2 family competence protein [Nitrospinota bacterium]
MSHVNVGAPSPFGHPLFALAFSLAVGVVVGRGESPVAILLMGGLFLYTLAPLDRPRRGVLGLAFLVGVGLILMSDREPPRLPDGYDRASVATFTVIATETIRDDAARYQVTMTTLDGRPVTPVTLRLSLRRRLWPPLLLPGDRMTMTAPRIVTARGSRNVGLFDYEEWLAARGIAGLLYPRRESTLTVDGADTHWRRPLEILKNRMRERLAFDDSRITAVAWATLLGDTGRIDHATRDSFSRSGLAHILSVSGLHVGFVATALYGTARLLLFFPAWRWRRRWAESGALITVAAGIALVGAVGYGLLTGPQFPAQRATIMVAVYLAALMTGRGRQFVGAFSLAALITLVATPWGLFDIGFLLSYGAVLFIALFMERYVNGVLAADPDPMERVDHPLASLIRRVPALAGMTGVTVAAGLATAPLIAYAFHQAPLWSLPLNLLVTPAAGFAVPLGILAGLTGWAPLVDATGWLMTMLAAMADRYGGGEDALPIPLPPAAAPMLTWLLLLALVGALPLPRPRWTIPALAMATLALWLWPMVALRQETTLTVRFVDVGQGLAVAAFWPQGGGLVIDGGG